MTCPNCQQSPIDMGQLKNKVLLQIPHYIPDKQGGRRRMWVISGTLWARIMPVKTHDSVVGLQSGHTITHTLHIRFHKAIKAGQRLSTDNHIYTIEHAEPTDDKRTFLKLLCVEKSF